MHHKLKSAVTDTPAIRQVVNKASLGKIEVVANNAGYGLFGTVEALTDEQIIQQINTNLIVNKKIWSSYLKSLKKGSKNLSFWLPSSKFRGLV
jgi:NAD(P)-dependent dehydrogenase (short-subunit alcohol dehydrogenase family)